MLAFPATAVPWLLQARPVGLRALEWRTAVALPVTLGFALGARRLRAVSRGGAVAGAVTTFLVFLGTGLGGFAGVMALFVLTWLATRYGYRRKQALGTAEKSEGRSARQVLANLGVAAGVSVAVLAYPQTALVLAVASALAEAAADTVSSELGQALEKQAHLVTSFRVVAPGTNGGISLSGTLAGCAAALVVAGTCVAAGPLAPRWTTVAAAAGILGMMGDSVLGATLEGPGGLGNDAVNLLSTLVAAVCGALLGWR